MLKPEDTFRVECVNSISEDMIVSLLNLYQPLILGDGILLFLTLHAEARHARKMCSHKHLCALMHMDIETLERARFRLEQFRLIRTWKRVRENNDNYIYRLYAPLGTEDFLSNTIYRSLFIESLGKEDTDKIVERLGNVGIATNDFKEVTKPFKHSLPEEILLSQERVAKPIQPRYKFTETEEISFDYERFFAKVTDQKFPIQARSEEVMALIGRLGTVYGIDADTMVKYVGKCTLVDSDEFNSEALKRMCEGTASVPVKKVKDPYQLPPVSFLQSKMNGREVSLIEKKIIEHLSVDFKFPNEVINVMLEYILRVSKNRLSRNFVDMVASEWARDGIETKEQAVVETKKTLKSSSNRPKYVIEATDYSDPKYNTEVRLTDKEKEDIQKKLKEMK